MSDEQWKPVVGYEGLYEVSNLGRVRSFGRHRRGINGSLRYCPGRILSAYPNNAGYPVTNLYADSEITSSRSERVHRLVAFAFLGSPPEGKNEVNHLNGDKTDARPENLEWVTHAENQAHAGETGLMARGDSHPRTKLTTAQVQQVHVLRAKGLSQHEIGEHFGVSRHVIGYILRGQTYRHITNGLRVRP